MSQNKQTTGTARVKRGMAEMLKGGVIMDVVDVAQAKIATQFNEMLSAFNNAPESLNVYTELTTPTNMTLDGGTF